VHCALPGAGERLRLSRFIARQPVMMHDLSLASLRRDLFHVDPSQISWRLAARNALGIALPLVLGEATGQLATGVWVTLGALIVAFVDQPKEPDPSKIDRMLIASLVVAAAAFTGSVSGDIHWLHVLLVVIWGFAGGLLMAFGPVIGQIGVGGIVLMLVMSAQPKSPIDALRIAALAMLGGLLQTAIAAAFGAWRDFQGNVAVRYPREAARIWATLHENLTTRSSAFRHAVRLAFILSVGDALARALELAHGYWVPLTIAIILRPELFPTVSRIVARLVGTGLGLVLATGLVHWFFGGTWERIVLLALLAFTLRLLGPANFALAAAPQASLIVVFLSLLGTSPEEAIVDRGVATAIGGLLTLGAFMLWTTTDLGGLGRVAEPAKR
jgi:uncharacterized membrane protein YccC